MSQYGAYARALDGQLRDDILLAYYTDAPNTAISVLGQGAVPPLRDVFVNVGSDLTSTTLTISGGGGSGTAMTITRIGGAPDQTAELVAGDTVEIVDTTPQEQASGGCSVTLTLGGVESIWSAGSCDFDITLHPGEGLPQEVVTATNCRTTNCTFGFGEVLHLVDNGSSQRTEPDRIGGISIWPGFDLVVEATLDDYTRGIDEVPFSWLPATLEVQAIAARSYAASYVASTDYLSAGCFCDLKNDATRQVYAGWLGGRALWNAWDAAALATSGKVLTHPQAPENGFIRAFYSSSNGGITEQGYDDSLNPLPYLRPVSDPFSLVALNPYRSWTTTVPAATFENALWSGAKQLQYVEIEAASAAGKVQMVRFTATDGSTASRTPKWLSEVISSTAICTKANGNACAGSASPFPSYYFDIPFNGFVDIDNTIHKADIEYLASLGVAIACDAGPTEFCPEDRMRREDLAAFIVGALDLPPTTVDYFHDDDGLPFEADINSLAEAGVTKGCNPPVNDEFCPDDTVTRGQTAAFIVRAWSLTDPGSGDRFVDDDASIFEGDIDRLAQAGITKGCNPPDNTKYCPERLLTRAEMSSFLARALRDL
jgi:SpoIID/LytB domain protein